MKQISRSDAADSNNKCVKVRTFKWRIQIIGESVSRRSWIRGRNKGFGVRTRRRDEKGNERTPGVGWGPSPLQFTTFGKRPSERGDDLFPYRKYIYVDGYVTLMKRGVLHGKLRTIL